MLKRRYQLLLLASIVLSVFYPSLFGELNSIDDVEMVTNLLNTGDWRLKDVFIPRGSGGLYYRPLLYLSFLLDKELWFMQGSFLHLENILLHLGNTILVYYLALYLLPDQDRESSYLPLIAALCFGLHPIATEPVDWVSGRTDVMAGIFVLLSAVFLLKFNIELKKRFFFFSVLSLLCGMLTKEVALAFLPGAFFILTAKYTPEIPSEHLASGSSWRIAVKVSLFAVIGAGSALFFFLLRSSAFTSNSSKIGMTLKFICNDPDHAFFVFCRIFGFYMKKLYWPFPLNFAIVELDPTYELLAIPLVLLCIIMTFSRTPLSSVFLAGVFMIMPSFPIAFGQIAWTPYAERYVYIASAFIICATVLFLGRQLRDHGYGISVKAGVPCLLALAGIATFQRNLTWQTNLSLYTDTVKKSPDFSKAWNELGVAYYHKKDLANAKISFAKASALYSLYYDEISDMNLAAILSEEGKEDDAARIYKKVADKSHYKSEKALGRYLGYLKKKAATEKNLATITILQREELKYSREYYALTEKPHVLYRIGEISLALGDRQGALEYFRKAYDKFPSGDRDKKIAWDQVMRIASK